MLHFEKVWQETSPRLMDELKDLWSHTKVTMKNDAADRNAHQAVFIVRSEPTGMVVGASTAKRHQVKQLNNNFLYEFQYFISDVYKEAGLDVKLSLVTFDFLEQEARNEKENTVGVFLRLENVAWKKDPAWQRAMWPETNMYFAGYTREGHPLWVHYFKHARI